MGGYKNPQGKWNTAGHQDRIVPIDIQALANFAKLYDKVGTPPLHARLPALHARSLNDVLAKLAIWPRCWGDIGSDYFSTVMWNETEAVKDGTITRRSSIDSGFASDISDLVLSGPHFFVGNPLNKNPQKICSSNKAYDVLDLENMPSDYLPRTNYRPMADRAEYSKRMPRVTWADAGEAKTKPVTSYYRIVNREMVIPSNERTLISTLIPPGTAHIYTLLGHALPRA